MPLTVKQKLKKHMFKKIRYKRLILKNCPQSNFYSCSDFAIVIVMSIIIVIFIIESSLCVSQTLPAHQSSLWSVFSGK